MITHSQILSAMIYEPTTGWFRWKSFENKSALSRWSGKRCGALHVAGYRQIQIQRKIYKAHRLAWFYVHGEWPSGVIDHKNGNADDNRIENLRIASHSQNGANSRQRRKSPKHLKGVAFHKISGRWRAEITKDYKRTYLGYFSTELEAHEAYVAAAKLMHGAFFCPGYDAKEVEQKDVVHICELASGPLNNVGNTNDRS